MAIKNYNADFITLLPKTYEVLSSGGLDVHPAVKSLSLRGSRATRHRFRVDSDINLWLNVDTSAIPCDEEAAREFLDEVTNFTLESFHGTLELDITIIFDIAGCNLNCLRAGFGQCSFNIDMTDCFGVYKNREFLNGQGCNMGDMLPFVEVYRNG